MPKVMPDGVKLSELRLDVNGRRLLDPCLEFVIYLDTPLNERILEFLERSMAALGPLVTSYVAEAMKRPAPFDDKAKTLVPTWVRRPRLGKSYYAEFSGASLKGGTSAASINVVLIARPTMTDVQQEAYRASMKQFYEGSGSIFGPPVTSLRVTIPLEHPLAEPTRFLEWVLAFAVARDERFVSGHAGLAMNHDEAVSDSALRNAMEGRLAALCLRHPGLDWDNTGSVQTSLLRWDRELSDFLPRIKRVNWLTFVSDRALVRLGGRDRLASSLASDPAIVMHAMGEGVCVQAGPAPQPGDVARHEFLPTYRRVAAALRPIRLETHSGMGLGYSDDEAMDWFNALDRDPGDV